ncbi:MAG TPA: penicillin acylase family protein [Terracidiphilus sp.]|nr:penicillin acylase family protein [Terracidiphilus sp.]
MADSDAIASSFARTLRTAPQKRWRWLRIVLYTLTALVLLLIGGVFCWALWLRASEKASLPQLDGTIRLPGLSAPVTVRRDGHGVPYIEAATQDDLFVAQGYVTAQDRLWQMDLWRRNANGELAEILGSALVKHDRMQRIFGFRRAAERIYANLDSDDRRRLDEYARGVNLFIQQHQNNLPAEFRMLLYKPRPWRGPDSISVATMMIDMLDTHWNIKVERERVRSRLHNPQLESELYPVGSWRDHPPTGDVIDWSKPDPERTQNSAEDETASARHRENVEPVRVGWGALREELGLPDCGSCAPGSNNWVISGKHTASGLPLLSNDMHLPIDVPNIWLMAGLEAPGIHVEGVTLPGIPGVIAGHNLHEAWGFTALYADVQDVYVEKLDGKGHYQAADGSWQALATDREVIQVRGGKDVTVDVESTDHGPIVTPVIPGETRPLALKWTLYDPSLRGMPIYQMNTASNWAEFSAALANWDWPTQNLVYADDQGHIAYHAVGRVPLRPAGLAAVPIADHAHEWAGYIPFDSMPKAVDPPSGFLATANARVTTDKSPYPLSLEWIDPYRVERIYKALQGREKLTPKDMLAVQTDIYSEVDQELGHRFAYAIDHASKVDDRLRKAADLMRSWDGKLTTDSAAASVVDRARQQFWPLVLEPKLGKLTNQYRWGEKDFAEEQIIMNGTGEWMLPGYKTWDDVLTEAARRGMDVGEAPADVSKWAYGSWHIVIAEHPLAALFPLITRVAQTGPAPQSGDETTVKQVGRSFGPSQRFTMDFSNVDGSTENIVLGESENPYSPYFRDQWPAWLGGTTFAMPFSDAAVAGKTVHTMTLEP